MRGGMKVRSGGWKWGKEVGRGEVRRRERRGK